MKTLCFFSLIILSQAVNAADSIYYPVKTSAGVGTSPNIYFIYSDFEGIPVSSVSTYKCEFYPSQFPGWTLLTDSEKKMDSGILKNACLVQGYLKSDTYYVMKIKSLATNGSVIAETAPFTFIAKSGATEIHPAKVLY